MDVIPYKSRKPLDPEDEDINEILGALVGDGWLGMYGHPRRRKQVCFCGNLNTETVYRAHIQTLIKRAFGVNGYYQERKENSTYYIIINSAKIFDFFVDEFRFPIGIKGAFDIDRFPKRWELQRRFIRGVFDTDGCIFFDKDPRYKREYPILDITLKNTDVLDWMARILESRGFRIIRYGRQLRLKGGKGVGEWFKEFSPKNDVHRRKYLRWLEKGP